MVLLFYIFSLPDSCCILYDVNCGSVAIPTGNYYQTGCGESLSRWARRHEISSAVLITEQVSILLSIYLSIYLESLFTKDLSILFTLVSIMPVHILSLHPSQRLFITINLSIYLSKSIYLIRDARHLSMSVHIISIYLWHSIHLSIYLYIYTIYLSIYLLSNLVQVIYKKTGSRNLFSRRLPAYLLRNVLCFWLTCSC
ncbi:unnamed protein product [Acanthosepion pharaonis]|uniref:Uncharacterized protein n=1 Tax=Acanthosepion pharaonis TaxID=158019 RepID=A0A812D9L4_ACAPH|nr:unnamed protein product [Sepia pharaonis]